ncbi:MAG: aminotransferase class I/II-fold pyridoxal phosphate-dependent enzyme [Candidatus Micrarchaeota archaeon]|nr:aminotransferase class I/II-fold pyridoxal phosphate-dependent enzyme [Candidatus Micrarchaeota archaeon]
MGFLSDRSKYAYNPIEEEDRVAEQLAKKGARILQLNRGDPARYFPTPRYIIDAYVEALKEEKTTYSRAEGLLQLADAVSKRYKRMYGLSIGPDDIIATEGVSEALSFLNSALINPGESAVLFKPYYPQYIPTLTIEGGKPILEDYDERSNWNVHTESLESSLRSLKSSGRIRRVKYMMITNPNNPTGTVLDRKVLEQIVGLARDYGLMLISDEIYDEIIFSHARFTSVCEVARGQPYVILNGASKDLDSTGFRIGFAIIPGNDKKSKQLKQTLDNYALVRLSVNTPAQWAITEAINNTKEHRKHITMMVAEIERRAGFVMKRLAENPYFTTVKPHGAFYVFPRIDLKQLRFRNDNEFVDRLLREKDVQVVRGSAFGSPSHFRIVPLPPKEILGTAIDRINEFCRKNAK